MAPEALDPKKPKLSNKYLKYSGLGFQFFGAIGVSAWAGWELDRYLDLKFPAFLIAFVFLSFFGMMYKLYKSID
jgi:F0F1-type ATP synthase assembly protein I